MVSQGHGPHGGGFPPSFKVYFDLLLTYRPGVTPITFDNFHTLLLADFIPRPDFQFSFEINPTPRYFELDYKPSQRLTLRAGRIWIPFDDMGPHNYFGGHINTSRLAQPNATSYFLPDIWADLGVGVKYDLYESSKINLTGDFYIVNGFGAGGTDPTGQVTGGTPTFRRWVAKIITVISRWVRGFMPISIIRLGREFRFFVESIMMTDRLLQEF